MMQEIQSYLEDHWRSGQAPKAPLFDPVLGDKIAEASSRGLDLGAALRFQRESGGPALRAMTYAERADLLAALAKALHAVRDALLDASILNTGVTRSDAKFDVDGGIATLSAYVDFARSLGGRRFQVEAPGLQLGRSPRFHGVHVQVPLRGVAVHINAFNFPVWGLAEKLACAIAAGVPVLTKPATATALPAYLAAKALVDARVLPKGTFAFLAGSAGDLLDHLLAQDVIAFTGSAETGRSIRSHPNVVRRSVRVNVEADSLNAAVLGPDCGPGTETFDLFIRETAREMTQKSGQKCTATRRVLVPRDRVQDVVEALKERLGDYPVGKPLEEGVRMGGVATPAQAKDVLAGMQKLASTCETVVGKLPDGKSAVIAPVVFLCRDPENDPVVHELEVFGPVTTLLPYDGSAESAASLVARGEGTLVTTVYTDSPGFQEAMFLDLSPWTGRMLFGSSRIAEHSTGPGLVLPSLVHGGPGRAGGGLELGGTKGLSLYQQTCAVQGYRPMLERMLGFGAQGDPGT